MTAPDAAQDLPTHKLRVALEFDVELTVPSPGPEAPVPPVRRLIERLVSGEGEDGDALKSTAFYAALFSLDQQVNLMKSLIGTTELEDLLGGVIARLSTEDQGWFRHILSIEEGRRACHEKWAEAGSRYEDSDGSEAFGDPDEVGWYPEVEAPLSKHCVTKIVGIRVVENKPNNAG